MDAFFTVLLGLCAGVNRTVEIFGAWLDSQTNIAADTKTLLKLVAQFVVAIGAVFAMYVASPFTTGTFLDKYPVLLVLVGGGLVGLGSDVIYQVIDIAKRLKGPSDNAPVG